MKGINLLFILLFSLFACQQLREELPDHLSLPLTIKEGYGPFYPFFGELSPEHIGDPVWGKTYLPVKNIPKHWTGVVKSMVWLDAHQLVYQNVVAGNISKAKYQDLQKSWE